MRVFGSWILVTFVFFSAMGCDTGPASTRTNSTAFSTLAERKAFLEKYVKFRRTYETLDFNVFYQNNGRGAPGPSDWDVQVVATVPASELQSWVPPGVKPGGPPGFEWVESVPTTLELSGVNEWYRDGSRLVGLDRERRIVIYRLSSDPIP